MKNRRAISRVVLSGVLWCACAGWLAWNTSARGAAAPPAEAIAELEGSLRSAKDSPSEARQRLAVKRVIRDGEKLLEPLSDSPDRFAVLEFLYRARQQLIALDDQAEHRSALLETARELVKAPDEFAALRLEADLLLSQAEVVKQGGGSEARSKALRPFVARYVDTPAGAKVLSMATLIALELGDSHLVNDLQEMIAERFAGDLDMISFLRDKLGGQVIGAPFVGTFERSDGKTVRFPMDALGRSTMLVFWSKEDGGENVVAGLAATHLANKEYAERLDIVSFNLDDLPDAGESIVRGHGVDWPVVRLPGGREHPVYKAYVRQDPRMLTVSPTGYTALLMTGTTGQKRTPQGTPDYTRTLGSMLARSWTYPPYVSHIASLVAGDFLVFDPEGFDPARPPEWKAVAAGVDKAPPRGKASVPEATLRAIQACFIPPPERYRLARSEARAQYAKAVQLCRKAIAAHPAAPDLWMVRNRLIVALLGLWKTAGELAHLEEAIAEAKTAVAAGYPPGCDIVARYAIACGDLRTPEVVPREVLDGFVRDNGGDKAPGPVLAAASLLALDVADRKAFVDYRRIILEHHADSAMMWLFVSFLLDRHHEYWLFQEPFTAGWSYARQEGYAMARGEREDGRRTLRAELETLDGKPFRIPEDLDTPWTVLLFSKPRPQQEAGAAGPPNPEGLAKQFAGFLGGRPEGAKIFLVVLDDDAEAIRAGFDGKEPPCPVLIVPNGMANPLVHRLGILEEDTKLNRVLIDRDGRVALMVSGLIKPGRGDLAMLANVIAREDENAVSALLERGDVEAAKDRAMLFAPPFDPTAVDERGRKLSRPIHNLAHLRARARVSMALGEFEKALADAEEVVSRQVLSDGSMSLRTKELDMSEALRDQIKAEIEAKMEAQGR